MGDSVGSAVHKQADWAGPCVGGWGEEDGTEEKEMTSDGKGEENWGWVLPQSSHLEF